MNPLALPPAGDALAAARATLARTGDALEAALATSRDAARTGDALDAKDARAAMLVAEGEFNTARLALRDALAAADAASTPPVPHRPVRSCLGVRERVRVGLACSELLAKLDATQINDDAKRIGATR